MAHADIADLNFKLLIDDTDFDKKVKEAEAIAQKLNTNISTIFDLKKKISVVSDEDIKNAKNANKILKDNARAQQQIAREVARTAQARKKMEATTRSDISRINTVNREKEAQAALQTAYAQERLNKLMESGNRALSKQSKLWQQVGSVAASYFSIWGAEKLVSNLVRITAEFEKQKVSLEAILRDVNGADVLFERIKDLAVISPFSFKELVTYTKQLSAYSVPMEELYDTTKMLADISAGLGVGMDRLILAYGQIRSASFLRGTEVRQLTEAGVPILQELSKTLTELEGKYVSVGEVFDKISARQVTFEMVQKIFQDMTSEGGKFYKMQETLASTLSGKLSNLRDAYEIMFSEIGGKTSGILNESVDALRRLAENYERVGKIIMELVAIYGAYKAMLLTIKVIEQSILEVSLARMAGNAIGKVTALNAGLEVLVKNTKAYRAVASVLTKINPWAALAAGVVAVTFALSKCLKTTTAFEQAMQNLNKEWNVMSTKSLDEFDTLWGKMKSATKGTKEYSDARKALFSKYDAEIAQLRQEGIVVDDNKESYDALRMSIEEAARSRFRYTATDSIGKVYDEALKEVYSGKVYSLEKLKEGLNLSSGEASVIWGLITGMITEDEISKMEEYSGLLDKIHNSYVSLGAGSSGPMKASEYIAELAGRVKGAKQQFQDATAAIDEFWAKSDEVPSGTESALEGWRKSIADIIADAEKSKIALGLKVDNNSSLSTVVSDVKARIDETTEAYRLNLGIDNKVAEVERKRLDYLMKINAVLGGKASGGSGGKSEEQTELETRINTMKELLSWYEKLKDAGMGEGQIKSVLAQFFPDQKDIIVAGNYKETLLELADALGKYGAAAEKSAQSLREDIAGGGLNNVLEAFKEMKKAAEDFADYMSSWSEGGILDGTGVNFDVTKVIQTYQKKLQEITKKEEEARQKLYNREKTKTGEVQYGLTFSADYNKITQLATRDIQNAMTEADNGIHELAQRWMKEWAEINGVPLEDWSQMTVSQLKAVSAALDEFFDESGEISEDMLPDAVKKLKTEYPQLYKQFVQSLGGNLEGTKKKLDAVASKEKMKTLKETVSKILELTDAFQELADASGNSGTSDVANAITGIGNTLKDAAQGFVSGDWIGMVLAIVVDLGKELISCITYAETLKNSIESAKVDALVQSWEAAMNSNDGIFGTDTIGRIKTANQVMKETREELSKLYEELSGQKITGYFANSWLMPPTTLENILYNVIAGKSNDIKAYEEAIAKGYSGLEAYIVKTVDFSGFANFIGVRDQFASLKDIISELGYEMYDVYGNLNADALQAILDTYEKLGAEDRAWMEEAIKYSNEYKAAMEELDSVISDQLSSTVTSLVDEMYDSFVACGDAAANVGDAIGEWETALYKSLLAGMIMDEWEEKFGDRIRALYTRFAAGENVESELELIDREMEDSANMWANFSNAIWSNLENLGALESSGDNTLGSGISSITEDTANLLASYINAMRSDLAGHRMEVQGISADVKAILGLIPSVPTLAEYLTQIQANTYNTSANTAEILARLDSVLGDGASSYIRIQ